MDKHLREQVVLKTKELIEAPSCHPETKAACVRWLEALDTEKEAEETALYVKELEQAIMPIDGLIRFAGSEQGKLVFGEETAARIEQHAQEIKAKGAKYCDCAACAACEEILAQKEAMLK